MRSNGAVGAFGFLMVLYAGILALAMFVAAKLFEYSLWTITGKDVPWYVDLLGGFVLNAVIFALAFICWLANLIGIHHPWIA